MERALPYHIPGPAGEDCTQSETREVDPENPKFVPSTPWMRMLAHLNRKIPSSIALLRRNALANVFIKLSTLPVLIDSLTLIGKDASVRLHDPTGCVQGTLHAEVLRGRTDVIERGDVLLLNGVSALEYQEELRSFRCGKRDDGVHLSIQACHISKIFKHDNSSSPTMPPSSLLGEYELQAKSPPQTAAKPTISHLPLRDQHSTGPSSRVVHSPFRESPPQHRIYKRNETPKLPESIGSITDEQLDSMLRSLEAEADEE